MRATIPAFSRTRMLLATFCGLTSKWAAISALVNGPSASPRNSTSAARNASASLFTRGLRGALRFSIIPSRIPRASSLAISATAISRASTCVIFFSAISTFFLAHWSRARCLYGGGHPPKRYFFFPLSYIYIITYFLFSCHIFFNFKLKIIVFNEFQNENYPKGNWKWKFFSESVKKLETKIVFSFLFPFFYIYYIIFLIKMSRFLQHLHKIYIKKHEIVQICAEIFLFEYLYSGDNFQLKFVLEWTRSV